MGKLKDIFKGRHSYFFWFMIATSVIFIFLWLVGPGNTIVHWIDAAVEVRRQKEQIEFYTDENARIDDRLDMLRTDRDTLEKFAREQFHFAVPGEDVYIIEQ